MKSRWKILYPVTVILALGNLAWFLFTYSLASRGIYLFFKIFLIYNLFFYLYRWTLILLGKIHRGLPLSIILLYGYLLGVKGPAGIATITRGRAFLVTLWLFGGILVTILPLIAFTPKIRDEEEHVPRESRQFLNIMIPAGITVGLSHPAIAITRGTTIIIAVLTITLILMGRKMRTHAAAGRTLTGITIAFALTAFWFDIPHRPPRLQTHRRSLVVITLEGIRPEEAASLTARRVGILRYSNAWTPSPLPSEALKILWGSGIEGYLPTHCSREMERHAVINARPEELPEELVRGFDSVETPRLSPDVLLAAANILPVALVGNLFTSASWQEICTRRNADHTTRLAERILDSVKEPFLLWVAYPPPDKVVTDGRQVSNAERRTLLSLHDGRVRETTTSVNELLDYLASHGFFPHTQVVITGLNGYARFEHDFAGPVPSLYPEMIHVPLIIFSTFIHRDEVVESDLPLSFLTTTFAHLGKIKVSEDQTSILTARPDLTSWEARMTLLDGTIHLIATPDDLLYIHESSGRIELYDRKSDPASLKDIHLCEPERVKRIMTMEGAQR